MNRTACVVLLGLIVLGTVTACTPSAREQEIEFRVPVAVREVETGLVEDRIVATGSLRAAEMVTLTVETAGVLKFGRDDRGRRVAEGDRVEAGQTIAEIIGEDVRIAARTEATQRRYDAARRDHESSLSLYDDGLITQQELRRSEAELAEAQIEWERSLLTEARNRLVTPIAGVILRLGRDRDGAPAADGQLVDPGFAVAQIAPVETLIADVDLVGADIARVAVGQPARVRHYAFEDRLFPAEVLRLAPSLDPITRAFKAEIEIDNDAGLLRPGMFVEVMLIAERRDDVPVVPRTAVAERGGTKVVFVLQGQKVSRREVVLGLGDDEIVEIRQGVEPGERIVVKGLETLSEGQTVRVTGA